MVKRTNLPRSGTTREVGGMISASSRKNTVSETRMEMERLTWTQSVIVNIVSGPDICRNVPTTGCQQYQGNREIQNSLHISTKFSPFRRCRSEDRIREW